MADILASDAGFIGGIQVKSISMAFYADICKDISVFGGDKMVYIRQKK
ncbi:hypothetical protein B4144_4282 [Bacillus atrophaeus]|nr:hypothetical protein B4144_4282 [Bacillus atrophaeus]